MANNLVYMFGKLSQAVGVLATNRYDVRNRAPGPQDKHEHREDYKNLPESHSRTSFSAPNVAGSMTMLISEVNKGRRPEPGYAFAT